MDFNTGEIFSFAHVSCNAVSYCIRMMTYSIDVVTMIIKKEKIEVLSVDSEKRIYSNEYDEICYSHTDFCYLLSGVRTKKALTT